MLKKACIFTLTLVVAVALSACSAVQSLTGAQSPTTQAGGTGSQGGQTSGSGTGGTNAQVTISPETRYAIGILKLQGTALAVTKDQATTLLPLWKAMLSLSSSNTAAPAEIQALQDQIKGSLTADQVASIEKLDLSGNNMRTIMSSLNIQFGGSGGTRSTLTPAQQQAFAAGGGGFRGGAGGAGGGFRPGGGGAGFPGGGAPGAGGAGGTGANGSTTTRPTPVGGYANRARSAVNPMYVNAVINVLETTAGLPTSTPFFRGPNSGTPNPNGQPNATSVPGSPNATSTPAPAISATPGS